MSVIYIYGFFGLGHKPLLRFQVNHLESLGDGTTFTSPEPIAPMTCGGQNERVAIGFTICPWITQSIPFLFKIKLVWLSLYIYIYIVFIYSFIYLCSSPEKIDFIGFNPYHVITKPSSAWKPPAATTQLDLTMPAGPSKDSFICQWTKALCTTAFER